MAKKKVVPPTREELVSMAKQINAVLNLGNPIKHTKKVTDEELTASIIENCKENVYEVDFNPDPTDETIIVYTNDMKVLFNKLGITILEGSPESTEVSEGVVDELIAEVGVPVETKEEPIEETPAVEPPVVKKAEKVSPPKKTGKDKVGTTAKDPDKQVGYNRSESVCDTIDALCKTGADYNTIMTSAEALYDRTNGIVTPSPKTNHVCAPTIKALLHYGILKQEGRIYKLIKK